VTLVDDTAEAVSPQGESLSPVLARFVIGVGADLDPTPLVEALAQHGVPVDVNPVTLGDGTELVRRLSGPVRGTVLRWSDLSPLVIVGDGDGVRTPPGGARSRWHTTVDDQLPDLRYLHLLSRAKEPNPAARQDDWNWIGLFAWTNAQCLSIAVEDLAGDPAGTARRVLQFLGAEQPAVAQPSQPSERSHRAAQDSPRRPRADGKMKTLPSVSIVVVSHNEGENLPLTVAAIRATVPDDVEVIVVDDWSTDGSVAALADLPDAARVVRPQARGGVTGARNAGAGEARGDVLVFADAHVDPTTGWLEALCAALSDREVGCATTTITQVHDRSARGQGFTWREPQLRMRWLRSGGCRPREVPFICGCLMAFRRDDFELVGGFDPGLVRWGSEDAEIGLHLWRRGRASVVVPQATVAHLFRPSGQYDIPSELVVHNTLRLAATHLPEPALAKVIGSLAQLPTFTAAYRRLVESDVWERRDRIAAQSRYDGAWFLDRFRIRALQ